MSTSLRFLGVAGYEIVGPEWRVLIDPFLSGNPSAPVSPAELEDPDLILVTHAAFDHLGDAAEISRRTGAPVVCGQDVRAKLIDDGVPPERTRAAIWGVLVEVAGITVRPLECHHWSMATLANGTRVTGTPLAFIVETEPGVRIYHYGDTSIFDMRLFGDLYSPTVGLIGVTDPAGIDLPAGPPSAGKMLGGEMNPDEGALVAEMLGLRTAIASHYTATNPDTLEFCDRVHERDSSGCRVALAPEPGETVWIGTDGVPISDNDIGGSR